MSTYTPQASISRSIHAATSAYTQALLSNNSLAECLTQLRYAMLDQERDTKKEITMNFWPGVQWQGAVRILIQTEHSIPRSDENLLCSIIP